MAEWMFGGLQNVLAYQSEKLCQQVHLLIYKFVVVLCNGQKLGRIPSSNQKFRRPRKVRTTATPKNVSSDQLPLIIISFLILSFFFLVMSSIFILWMGKQFLASKHRVFSSKNSQEFSVLDSSSLVKQFSLTGFFYKDLYNKTTPSIVHSLIKATICQGFSALF